MRYLMPLLLLLGLTGCAAMTGPHHVNEYKFPSYAYGYGTDQVPGYGYVYAVPGTFPAQSCPAPHAAGSCQQNWVPGD